MVRDMDGSQWWCIHWLRRKDKPELREGERRGRSSEDPVRNTAPFVLRAMTRRIDQKRSNLGTELEEPKHVVLEEWDRGRGRGGSKVSENGYRKREQRFAVASERLARET
jgi:hypothetical protein